MGLDMYLKATTYMSAYNHSKEEESEATRTIASALGMDNILSSDSPSVEVKVNVGYWRKANAIHRWFVENVQDGEDDCRPYEVSRGQLESLRDACKRVLEVVEIGEGQPVHNGTTWKSDGEVEEHFVSGRAILNGTAVAEILPTTSGFFFGSTDYDEWYLQDIERTIDILDKVLSADLKDKTPEGAWVWYEYESSW